MLYFCRNTSHPLRRWCQKKPQYNAAPSIRAHLINLLPPTEKFAPVCGEKLPDAPLVRHHHHHPHHRRPPNCMYIAFSPCRWPEIRNRFIRSHHFPAVLSTPHPHIAPLHDASACEFPESTHPDSIIVCPSIMHNTDKRDACSCVCEMFYHLAWQMGSGILPHKYVTV